MLGLGCQRSSKRQVGGFPRGKDCPGDTHLLSLINRQTLIRQVKLKRNPKDILTFMCNLAFVNKLNVVCRFDSGPSGTSPFNFSRHKRRWARLQKQGHIALRISQWARRHSGRTSSKRVGSCPGPVMANATNDLWPNKQLWKLDNSGESHGEAKTGVFSSLFIK